MSRSTTRFYSGWWMVAVAAAAMVGTLPGRTQGLGLVTEPLLLDLDLDRITYAGLNFWATLLGASGAIGVGRLLDRLGSRVVLTGLAALLGAVVCWMSQVASIPTLALGLTLTRALGQSALSVVSISMVGQWFVRRLHTAMALYSVLLSVGFMLAFPLVGAAVQTWGRRVAWLIVGIALAGGLAPFAWLIVRRSPEACGLLPDGEPSAAGAVDAHADMRRDHFLAGYSCRSALSTPTFWIFAVGAALYGLDTLPPPLRAHPRTVDA